MKRFFLFTLVLTLFALGGAGAPVTHAIPQQLLLPASPGSLDLGFGGFGDDGSLSVNGFGVTDVALQIDGSLILAGRDGPDELVVMRRLANGDLDSGFGDGGEVRLNVNGVGQKVAVQSDGKLLVAGSADASSSHDFFVARFLRDGTPDSDFGINGVATTDFDGGNDHPVAIAVQTDGKIVVAGTTNEQGGDFDFALVRYTPNGQEDDTFGGDGKVTTGFGSSDLAHDMFIQPDGKIVVGGEIDDGSFGLLDDDFGLTRYNPDGSLDSSFDGDGKTSTGLGGITDSLEALALQPDGKIVAVGDNGACDEVAVARFHGDGSLDDTLDGDGKLSFDVSGIDSGAEDVWIQPDGKYLLLVTQDPCDRRIPTLVRLLPDGSLDAGFGNSGVLPLAADGGPVSLEVQPDGKVIALLGNSTLYRFLPNADLDWAGQTVANFAAFEDDVARDIVLQPDGKVLVAGAGAAQPGARDVALARYHPDGSLDTSFSLDGMAYFATNSDEEGRALALQPDGKIVVAGNTDFSGQDFAVYRLNADGTHDTTFNVVGYRIVVFSQGDDVAHAVAVLPDGKILVGGHTADDAFALARLQPDGRDDPAFGTDGKAMIHIGSGRVEVRDMLVLPDGRIVLGGFHNSGGPARGEFVLAAFLPDGAPDLDFGSDGTGIVEMGFSDGFGRATYDTIQALALLPNGLIVASGYSGADWATVLFNDDGTLANYPFSWPLRTSWGMAASARDVVVQEDGKFIIAGAGINAGETDSQFLLARYRLGGAGPRLDVEFGGDGRVETTLQERAGANAVAIDGNKIYVAGYSDNGHDLDFAVAKYATDDVTAGQFRFQQDSYNVAENAGAVEIGVERINGSDGEVTLGVDTFDGTATAGQDYPATAEVITFADGETEKTVSIPIFDNNTAEPDETFLARLGLIAGPGTIIEPSETTITILDDDTTPPGVLHFSADHYAVPENGVEVTITVQRSGGTSDEVQVSYETFDGSATSGSDYMPALGTLTFPDGETEQTFTVTLLDDPGAEGSETFTIKLSNVVGVATLGEPSMTTVTILDNETAHFVYLPAVQR